MTTYEEHYREYDRLSWWGDTLGNTGIVIIFVSIIVSLVFAWTLLATLAVITIFAGPIIGLIIFLAGTKKHKQAHSYFTTFIK